jgi:hypothetical protein
MNTILAHLLTTIFLTTYLTGALADDDPVGAASEAAKAEGELIKAKSGFRETWVNPDVDFSKYNKILPGKGEFEFRDVGPAKNYSSSMRSTSSKSGFGIRDADKLKFEEVVGEAFIKELSRSKKYDVVSAAGPGTILLEGAVLDIVSHVPPEPVGRSNVYLTSVATVTLVLELLDSETGQVLAYVEERRKIQPPGSGQIDMFSQPTNSVSVWSDIRRWASSSASRLRKGLEKAQKG